MNNTLSHLEYDMEPVTKKTIEILIKCAPASLQSKNKVKEQFQEQIRSKIPTTNFYFTDDVWIDIEWCHDETIRYTSDSYCDLDNIVKPILDSICGPHGVMVDDSQVQAFNCSFYGMYLEDSIHIAIHGMEESMMNKDGFMFCQVHNAMYIPMALTSFKNCEMATMYYTAIKEQYKNAYTILEHDAKLFYSFRPTLRAYHYSKINKFPCIKEQETENLHQDKLC